MGFYDKHVLPIVLNLSCGTNVALRQRQKVVRLAVHVALLKHGVGPHRGMSCRVLAVLFNQQFGRAVV